MKRIEPSQQTQHGISNQHLTKEHLMMPNSTRPELQNQLSQSHEPIRVLPADPEGSKINSAFSGNGYIQFDIPSTISRDRRGPYPASRLNVGPDGTVDFRMYGDLADPIVVLQSDESGCLNLILLPYQTHNVWRISIDKVLEYCRKRSPNGGDLL